MKKILILSSMVSLLILGCGSGGGSDDGDNKESIDSALKIGDVVYSTPAGINFGNKMRTNLNKTHRVYKSSILNSKTTVQECSLEGTMSYEETATEDIITFNTCTNLNNETYLYEYYNGTIGVSKNQESMFAREYWYIPNTDSPYTGVYMNLSISSHQSGNILETEADGRMTNFSDGNIIEDSILNKVTIKEDSSNNAIYLDGSYKYKAGCIDESYTFKTLEWLVPNSNNEEEYTSGIIIVNGMTYTYRGDRVIVKYGDKEGEFSQQELNEEMKKKKTSTECGFTPIERG
jgi:hypothetical protein